MSTVKISLPDGRSKDFAMGVSARDVAKEFHEEKPMAVVLDGQAKDMDSPFTSDAKVKFLKANTPEALDILRHSTAHLMAQAVQELYPGTKLAIGPPIEDGFYYDFDSSHKFLPEDLPKIEKKMKELSDKRFPVVKKILSKQDAVKLMDGKSEKYKVELANDLGDQEISFYEQGEFVDLCRGPHVSSTGYLKAFKVLSVAGAYWRGDEKKPMLQRLYGTAFWTKPELEEYLKRLEEAKLRDHRKLGKELGLFHIYDEAGAGLVFYLPKGATVRRVLEDFEKDEHVKRGYQTVITPHILKGSLWRTSGHYENYNENMIFTAVEEQEYVVKPMNCPGHILIYKSELRSYRDLPMRLFELGTVYRAERGGTMHGLMRVRGFTQDDAHLFCSWEQYGQELENTLDFVKFIFSTFGFEYVAILSTKGDKKVIGTEETWAEATSSLEKALKANGMVYTVEEGEAAFYGPKIDFKLKDCLGRIWQCATIQLDFNLPERFQMEYVSEGGEKKRPVMIHRALFGSLERFFGVLIEHYAGAFPTWLAPVQAKILPITDRQKEYADQVAAALTEAGLRVEVDHRNEKLGFKIREGQLEKVPYLLVVGDKEQESKTINVRPRKEDEWGAVSQETFIQKIKEEIKERKN